MAEIINHNPQDNPRLNEIYEILLLAGYFRIRIASLKAFDKVIGGIAWCITSSNFSIEVQYNDEMQIGQKIKVSQHICSALINMKCPYSIQPFQLQGLDVNSIFPVVQWLVKFVYETRFQRQKYNRQISVLLGKDILKLQNRGNPDKIPQILHKRARVNKEILQIKYNHPIRVYSTLLEFNDSTSLKMYHKLHNIIVNKMQKEKQRRKNDKNKDVDDIMTYLQNQDDNLQEQDELNNFGEVGKFSLKKLQKIIEDNKEQLEEAIKEFHEQEEPEEQHQVVAHQEGQEIKDPQQQKQQKETTKETTKDKELRNLKIQNDKYEVQIQALRNQLQNLNSIQKQIQEQKKQISDKKKTVVQNLVEVASTYQQIEQIGDQIQKQLSQKKLNNKIEKLVDKKMKLKQKRGQIKKKAKAKLQEMQEFKGNVQASIPEIDEQAFKNMLEQAEMKKEIYDKKYEQLTKVNQELAILQRKAENYTSPAEITQYHQRFIELFQSINCLIEQKRSMYGQITNLQSIRKVIDNYQQFLKNAKDGVVNAKKKNDKKQLADNIKQILFGFEGNMKNAKVTCDKLKSNREGSYAAYMDLIKLQRDYLKLLRNFKVEYENVQKLYQ